MKRPYERANDIASARFAGNNEHAMTSAAALASYPAESQSPAVTGCPLNPSPDAASRARSFTRRTLESWRLDALSADAEIIVSELLANAVRHGCTDQARNGSRPAAAGLWLWLLRDAGSFMCVVTDPSELAPAFRQPGLGGEDGRGLHVIHALSDHWGWSPFGSGGKAVWAILCFDEDGRARGQA
jgi:anti-sigma regulatory factor (Ser/Thr protein kinase)